MRPASPKASWRGATTVTLTAELLYDGADKLIQVARIEMMGHPVPDFVQSRHKFPGRLLVSADDSTADTGCVRRISSVGSSVLSRYCVIASTGSTSWHF